MKNKIMIRYDKNKAIRERINKYGIDATLIYLNKTVPDMVKELGEEINYHKEDYTKEELEKIMKERKR